MTFFKILTACLGIAFILFGYFIFFRRKYSLVNGFDEDFKAGLKTEAYARRVGLVEFVIGIVLVITAILLTILT